jgi:hypothetical protein
VTFSLAVAATAVGPAAALAALVVVEAGADPPAGAALPAASDAPIAGAGAGAGVPVARVPSVALGGDVLGGFVDVPEQAASTAIATARQTRIMMRL